jgi:hypothetical protein
MLPEIAPHRIPTTFRTPRRDLPKGLPPETIIENQKKFSEALMLWNSSIEPLEALMAPYLNYHYASAPSALAGLAQSWWRRARRPR